MSDADQDILQDGPMDAVITWVDGDDLAHKAKRARYLGVASAPLHENGINPHRWANSDEILFCLRSIEANAPWVRRVWIVVDGQGPDLSSLSAAITAKITLVDHRHIFRGFETSLPTFNSLAIESMLWRIEGLSDRFLYFNDDVFLTAPIVPSDMFWDGSPVLRGKWVDLSPMVASTKSRADPALFNHFMQMNAALEAGFDLTRVFVAAHVVHPFSRPVMKQLFASHSVAFCANISHRFRDINQFSPQALHNHACLAMGRAVTEKTRDYIHLRGAGAVDSEAAHGALLAAVAGDVRFLCVNDLPHLTSLVPDARELIARAVAPLDYSVIRRSEVSATVGASVISARR